MATNVIAFISPLCAVSYNLLLIIQVLNLDLDGLSQGLSINNSDYWGIFCLLISAYSIKHDMDKNTSYLNSHDYNQEKRFVSNQTKEHVTGSKYTLHDIDYRWSNYENQYIANELLISEMHCHCTSAPQLCLSPVFFM